MNAEFEKYIGDLSPELQEKARQCKTKEDLNAFIEENDLELPEDALEAVAGGCGTCKHDTDKTLENWISVGEPPTIKGVKAYNLMVHGCSKCGGNKQYSIHAGVSSVSGNTMTVTVVPISEAEFNTYKTTYNYRCQFKA